MNWLIISRGRFLVDLGVSCRWILNRNQATRFRSKYLASAVIQRESRKKGTPEMKVVPDLKVIP